MDYSQISGVKAPKYALLAVAALAAGLFFATPELKASADTVTTPVAIAPLTQVMDDGGSYYVFLGYAPNGILYGDPATGQEWEEFNNGAFIPVSHPE